MNYVSSNKWLLLIFIIMAFILFAPAYDLVLIFKRLSLTNFSDVLNQSKTVRMIIKQFATYGVLLLISFFVFGYLFLIAIVYEKARSYIYLIVLFVCFGGLGYFFCNQEKIEFKESSAKILDLSKINSKFKAEVKFKYFQDDFKKDLEDAAAGKLKIALNHRITSIGDKNSDLFYQKHKLIPGTLHKLTTNDINELLKNKKLAFLIDGKDVVLEIRDLKGSCLNSRNDTLEGLSNSVELCKDGGFFVAFYVLSKDGRILRVYV